tara:strand:- start:1148 stop:1399 length:252 start_codon:yes stop_codon:yes gene_type:complete
MSLVKNTLDKLRQLATVGDKFGNVSETEVVVGELVLLLVIWVLVLLFAKFLWNNYACRFITVLKPVRNILDILALQVVLAMVL